MIYVVSGGGTKLFAAICVTYPAGATCTCAGNGKTWTAKTTSGQWVFAVPAVGSYTVTAGSKSQSVAITAEGQGVMVNLNEMYLVEAGVGLASGLSVINVNGGSTVVNADKSISFKGAANGNAYQYLSPGVDVTNYSTMYIRVKGTYYCSYGLGTTTALSASVKGEQNYAEETLSLDISSLSGTYYPAVQTNLYSADINTTIYDWWLE